MLATVLSRVGFGSGHTESPAAAHDAHVRLGEELIPIDTLADVAIDRGTVTTSGSFPPQVEVAVGVMGANRQARNGRWLKFSGRDALDTLDRLHACGFLSADRYSECVSQFSMAHTDFVEQQQSQTPATVDQNELV